MALGSVGGLLDNLNSLTQEIKKEAKIEREEEELSEDMVKQLDDAISRVEKEKEVIDVLMHSGGPTQAVAQIYKNGEDRSLQQLEEDLSAIHEDLQKATADLNKKTNEMQQAQEIEQNLDQKFQELGQEINSVKEAADRASKAASQDSW